MILRRTHFANRILLMIVLIIFALTAAFLTHFLIYIRNVLNQQLKTEGLTLAGSIAQSSELAAITGEPAFLEQVFTIAMDNPQVVFVAVYDVNGNIINKASKRPMDFSLQADVVKEISIVNVPFLGGMSNITSGKVEDFYSPIRTEGEEALTDEILDAPRNMRQPLSTIGLVRLGLSRSRINAALAQSVSFALVVAVIASVLGVILAIFISRRITRPLQELETGTKKIAEGKLDVGLTIESDDEVGSLAHAFNTMVGALRSTTISRDYFDGILRAMSDMLIVADEDGRLKQVNDKVLESLGYKLEELQGKPIEKLFAMAPGDFEKKIWQPLLGSNTIEISEIMVKRKNDSTFFVELSGSFLMRPEGKADIIINAHDITERKEADEALRQSEEKYRDLFESAHDLIQSVNMEGRFEYVNHRWLEVMGYAEDELKNLTLMDILRKDQIHHCMGIFEKVMAGQSFEGVETVFVSKGGEEIYVEGNVNGQFKDGKFVATRAIFRDITERRKADERVKEANRELMRLSQARSDFTSMVSHELRTPLSSIKAGIDIVLKGIDGSVNDAQKETLGIAKQNVDRLTKLISNILDYTKLDAGKMDMSFERVNMNDLVQEVFNLMRPAVDKKQIAFNTKLPEKPIEAVCDPERIKQVLINLINNAVKFTESKGWIQLRLGHADGIVKVDIEDNGMGIKEEDQKRIFEMFAQASGSGKWKAGGSGLGLTICKQIMELHDGDIRVSSMFGKGSTFTVSFPDNLPLPA